MEYQEIKLLKQSEKSTVDLVREKAGSRVLVRKRLKGKHLVYELLKDCSHPYLPKLYEVEVSEDYTTVIEEYIEGETWDREKLSGKQFRQVAGELCSVLEFLHTRGIIHRDIKPSNVIFAQDGHLRLIDFDASRTLRDGAEQDTMLLGTRGFAPPEQYGFTQTDQRADIYALGVTLEQFLGKSILKRHYKRVLQKCRNLDPDRRYQSVSQVRKALFPEQNRLLWGGAALALILLFGVCWAVIPVVRERGQAENQEEGAELTVLPVPGNVHWDGETGTVVWDNVLESGVGNEVQFTLRLYRRDSESAPGRDDDDWYKDELVRVGGSARNMEAISWNITPYLEDNGFYYFTVSARGDGIRYADSPFAVSDGFEYTGESAPPLAVPTGLAWRLHETGDSRSYCATWDNLEDYAEKDVFNVTFYDETGAYVMENTWPKSYIEECGLGGIYIPTEFLVSKPGAAYRFTVQVYSSLPNEYSSSPMPDPVPEEYYSPWLHYGTGE